MHREIEQIDRNTREMEAEEDQLIFSKAEQEANLVSLDHDYKRLVEEVESQAISVEEIAYLKTLI